ncbi:MAG: methyltransferase domain-containing protein [bacterium]|nr:methyltransferase domain-containing protein [bacterium]
MLLFLVVLFGALCVFLLVPLLWGAPYVPSKPAQIRAMLDLTNVRPGEQVADLGSGDGRVVIAFARAGAEAHGYEINPLLVWRARRRIRAAGLAGKAFVYWQSLWRADVRTADVVTVFGVRHIMGRLERKLRRELKPGARVVSNGYQFPVWSVERSADRVTLFIQYA